MLSPNRCFYRFEVLEECCLQLVFKMYNPAWARFQLATALTPCDLNELQGLCSLGYRLQYHVMTHLSPSPSDKGCIKVIKAYFGRHDETTCNNTPTKMTFCTSYTADTYVKKTCVFNQDKSFSVVAKGIRYLYKTVFCLECNFRYFFCYAIIIVSSKQRSSSINTSLCIITRSQSIKIAGVLFIVICFLI